MSSAVSLVILGPMSGKAIRARVGGTMYFYKEAKVIAIDYGD